MDDTNILACAETEHKNMSSDASRQELKDQDGLNAEYQRYKGGVGEERGRAWVPEGLVHDAFISFRLVGGSAGVPGAQRDGGSGPSVGFGCPRPRRA